MRICPNCKAEIDERNFTCPVCKTRLPILKKGSGHSSMGNLDEYNAKCEISIEDKNMIRDKNHQSSSVDDDDFDCAQPYNYITHENGDRN